MSQAAPDRGRRLIANAEDRRKWTALAEEARACGVDLTRPTLELERLAKTARQNPTPHVNPNTADPFRTLVRLSLGFCIETEHGRKHACADMVEIARSCAAKNPTPERQFRRDIDG